MGSGDGHRRGNMLAPFPLSQERTKRRWRHVLTGSLCHGRCHRSGVHSLSFLLLLWLWAKYLPFYISELPRPAATYLYGWGTVRNKWAKLHKVLARSLAHCNPYGNDIIAVVVFSDISFWDGDGLMKFPAWNRSDSLALSATCSPLASRLFWERWSTQRIFAF